MDASERIEFADMVAQAVIDRIEERQKINLVVDMVLQRIAAIQREEALAASSGAALDSESN